MFALPAISFQEIKQEARVTINQRCEIAVDKASKHDITVYWCNLNDESDRLKELDRNAVEVRGDMNIDKKEDILISFAAGDIKKLITKTSITAFGLNWQHCNHTTYFPTYSYEQYYQAIRRFWRFGQQRNVFVDLILSDGQEKIMKTLIAKKEQAIKMFKHLTEETNRQVNLNERKLTQNVELPKFLLK